MNSQREVQEVYFEQCEPQFQESTIVQECDLIKEENRYGSCFIQRNAPKTAPNHKNIRISDLKYRKNSNYLPSEKQSTNLKRRLRTPQESSISPIKNQSQITSSKPVSSTPKTFRTIHINKKQQSSIFSISPETQLKSERKSESPNRRHLYWQSYLLEGKDSKNGNLLSNSSGYISRTLKLQKDSLPPLTASSYIAMMSDTHEILIQKNLDQKREIASLTKIMTAYTVINLCNSHGIKIRQHKITVHQQASWMEGTSANLKTDQEFLIIDLLYGLLLPSGNDAGVALAQHFGKFLSFKLTKDDAEDDELSPMKKFQFYKEFYDNEYERDSIKLFVFEMNKNSFKIGLKNTQFVNPTGLSNSKNFSTSRDMALLTSHCLKNHLLRQIFKRKVYTCEVTNEKLAYTKQVQWKNTNRHLYQFRQCIGVKTGITPSAGPCLSSAYKIMNREVVVIVLNSSTIEDRYEDARSIYKWCRRNMRIY